MKNELLKIITDKEAVAKQIHSFIQSRIKDIVGEAVVAFTIGNLEIKEFPKIVIKVLTDERSVEIDTELNRQGVHLKRKVDKSDISPFQYTIENYLFSDINKKRLFRVPKTEDTFPCDECNGRKEITCSRCHGGGKNQCSQCDGQGQQKCSDCGGRGEKKCSSCGGKGTKTEGSGDNQRTVNCSSCSNGFKRCTSCNQGWNTCSSCSGSGQVICSRCSGRGEVTCPNCSGYGYFNEFLNVKSIITVNEINQFLKGSPNLDSIEIINEYEEFDYKKDFSFEKIKKLIHHTADFKVLFSKYIDTDWCKAKLVRFCIATCYTIEFSVNIGKNKFRFEFKDDTFVTKSNFDSSLFYSFINGIPIDSNFDKLKRNKEYLIKKIDTSKDLFKKIDEYDKLKNIISSRKAKSKKLSEIRQISSINTEKYDKYLQKKLLTNFGWFALAVFIASVASIVTYNNYSYSTLLIKTLIIAGTLLASRGLFQYMIKVKSNKYRSIVLTSILVCIFPFIVIGGLSYRDHKKEVAIAWGEKINNAKNIIRHQEEILTDLRKLWQRILLGDYKMDTISRWNEQYSEATFSNITQKSTELRLKANSKLISGATIDVTVDEHGNIIDGPNIEGFPISYQVRVLVAILSDLSKIGAEAAEDDIQGYDFPNKYLDIIREDGYFGTRNPNATYSIVEQTDTELKMKATAKLVQGSSIDVTFDKHGYIIDGPNIEGFDTEIGTNEPLIKLQDDLLSDLAILATDGYHYKIRPTNMGGGNGTYAGYAIDTNGIWGSNNPNATYQIVTQTATVLKLKARSKQVSGATIDVTYDGNGKVIDGSINSKGFR